MDSDSLDHVVLSLSWSRLVMNNRLDMLSDLVMGARWAVMLGDMLLMHILCLRLSIVVDDFCDYVSDRLLMMNHLIVSILVHFNWFVLNHFMGHYLHFWLLVCHLVHLVVPVIVV